MFKTLTKMILQYCLLISHALSSQSVKSSNTKVKKTDLPIKSALNNADPSLLFGS